MRKISDSLLVINNGDTSYYTYGYNQYINKKVDKTFEIKDEVKVEKKEIKKDKNELKKEMVKLEKEINTKEERLKQIALEFEKEEVYSDFMIMQELENESDELEDELESLMIKWEKVATSLEEKSN